MKTSYTYTSSKNDQCSEQVKTSQLMVQEFSVHVRTAWVDQSLDPIQKRHEVQSNVNNTRFDLTK